MSCKPLLVTTIALAVLVISAGSASLEAQPSPDLPKKHALLIGVNKYLAGLSVPELSYAEADVASLKSALQAQGYDVTDLVGLNASHDYVISYLEQEARVLRSQDSFVLYIAGHGVKAEDHVYWLAHNTALDFLGATAIRLTHLMDYVKDIKAGRKIVLLDHCYSGELLDDLNPVVPPAGGDLSGAATPPVGTLASAAPPSTTIPRAGRAGARLSGTRNVIPTVALSEVTGTSPGALVLAASRGAAFEMSEFKHGLFTQVLLDALTTRKADTTPSDGNLSVDELRNYVRSEVVRISGALNLPQTPLEHINGNLQGWLVATGLRATRPEDVISEILRIEDVLFAWQQQGHLSTQQRVKCHEVLEKWREAVQRKVDERTLADYALLQTIRDLVSDESSDVASRAGLLKADLNRRGGGR